MQKKKQKKQNKNKTKKTKQNKTKKIMSVGLALSWFCSETVT